MIRKLTRAKLLSILPLLGSLALVAAIVFSGSDSQVFVPSTPSLDSAGEAADSGESSLADTHSARDVSGFNIFSPVRGGAAFDLPETLSVEAVLEKGLNELELSPTHVAFRGTAAADSVRCEWRGIARTLEPSVATRPRVFPTPGGIYTVPSDISRRSVIPRLCSRPPLERASAGSSTSP